jgi:hypothetical protein
MFISDNLLWPGYGAIVPVLGTAIVPFAQDQSSILTKNRVCRWVGEDYSRIDWVNRLWHLGFAM